MLIVSITTVVSYHLCASCQKPLIRFFEFLAILPVFAGQNKVSDKRMAFAPLDFPQLATMQFSVLVSFAQFDDVFMNILFYFHKKSFTL